MRNDASVALWIPRKGRCKESAPKIATVTSPATWWRIDWITLSSRESLSAPVGGAFKWGWVGVSIYFQDDLYFLLYLLVKRLNVELSCERERTLMTLPAVPCCCASRRRLFFSSSSFFLPPACGPLSPFLSSLIITRRLRMNRNYNSFKRRSKRCTVHWGEEAHQVTMVVDLGEAILSMRVSLFLPPIQRSEAKWTTMGETFFSSQILPVVHVSSRLLVARQMRVFSPSCRSLHILSFSGKERRRRRRREGREPWKYLSLSRNLMMTVQYGKGFLEIYTGAAPKR